MQQSDITTNWETRSGFKGFLAKFLFEKAKDCWNYLDLQAFEEVVALLVYGLVLFQFFDHLHHCFTFPNYQLVPNLEEFSQLLRIPILN